MNKVVIVLSPVAALCLLLAGCNDTNGVSTQPAPLSAGTSTTTAPVASPPPAVAAAARQRAAAAALKAAAAAKAAQAEQARQARADAAATAQQAADEARKPILDQPAVTACTVFGNGVADAATKQDRSDLARGVNAYARQSTEKKVVDAGQMLTDEVGSWTGFMWQGAVSNFAGICLDGGYGGDGTPIAPSGASTVGPSSLSTGPEQAADAKNCTPVPAEVRARIAARPATPNNGVPLILHTAFALRGTRGSVVGGYIGHNYADSWDGQFGAWWIGDDGAIFGYAGAAGSMTSWPVTPGGATSRRVPVLRQCAAT